MAVDTACRGVLGSECLIDVLALARCDLTVARVFSSRSVGSEATSATFRQVALKFQKTREISLTGDPVKTVEVLANRYTLNETERTGVLRHLIVEGDLSAYGLVNAVTHYSQEVEDYDRATEFEALGGRLIDLPAKDWKELAQAA